MRALLFAAAGLAIAGFGVYLVLQSGARAGEVKVTGTVESVDVIQRNDGSGFDLHQHTATYTDPATGDQRRVESPEYRQQPPRIGQPLAVYVETASGEARAPGPESRRNGLIAAGFGAVLVLFSLREVVMGRSS